MRLRDLAPRRGVRVTGWTRDAPGVESLSYETPSANGWIVVASLKPRRTNLDLFLVTVYEVDRSSRRALRSALTIAGSYAVGGLIPLSPYMALSTVTKALAVSVGVTLVALFVFGYVKGRFTGAGPARSAIQTMLIGGIAAGAAFAIARVVA